MRIFLDTNVLVSAMATRGLCADVLREVLIHHELVISAPLLEELEDALRKKLSVPNDLIAQLVEILQRDSHFARCSTLTDVSIQDKDDLIIISSALDGEAEVFVTGDNALLGLEKIGNMEIVSPRKFWEKLKAQLSDEH